MKKLILSFVICILALLYASKLNAETHTSVINGNWSSPSTWSPSSIPDSTDDIIISTNVIVNNSYTCNNLKINSGCILTIKNTSGLQLTVNGVFFVSPGSYG